MRKILVKNFVGYYSDQGNIPKQIAKLFLIVIPAVIALTGLQYPLILVLMALLAGLLYFLPFKTKTGSALRATRICWPGYSISFTIIAATLPFSWVWYHVLLALWMILLSWIGFNGWGGGYFDIFKVRYSELDDEQRKDLDNNKLKLNLNIKN
jgi:hypothetical protein